ncbi:2-iminobutanoate/2-iminopropanoate deaminase-like [Pollicipes pollicipes]|uniref:2-iminobutanoate/2-iminopropanoate deaminase-like n=1 Tax=Pollicipes pollicipes TaxID=41117 RepID=UPI001884BCC0|nr:2-iminobutanoate/2-iminopropanoate deaminase-like [Pollicipes pollicipes]
MKRTIYTPKAAPAIGPYSQAVLVNDTLYVSGQLGIDATSGELCQGVEAQTRQALENMGHILHEAGMTHADVVKATVLLADMNDFSKVNEVYKTFFTSDFPARAAYQVAALPKGGMVEIEAIAFKCSDGDSRL